jgi:hypothetical protein
MWTGVRAGPVTQHVNRLTRFSISSFISSYNIIIFIIIFALFISTWVQTPGEVLRTRYLMKS